MELDLNDKVAFVTGAGNGIGKAIALGLARAGAQISFLEPNKEACVQSTKEIEAFGVKAMGNIGSVTKVLDIREAVNVTINRFGKIDILVNCAGSAPVGDVLTISHEDWDKCFDVKFLGYVRCVKEIAPYMIKNRGGKIINLIGTGATEIFPLHVSGAANNAAAVILTSYLAQELGKHNILVVGINPGPVGPTQKLARHLEEISKEFKRTVAEVKGEMISKTALKRFCAVEDVANLAVFLASEANKHISGEIITIDGGYTKAIMNG